MTLRTLSVEQTLPGQAHSTFYNSTNYTLEVIIVARNIPDLLHARFKLIIVWHYIGRHCIASSLTLFCKEQELSFTHYIY